MDNEFVPSYACAHTSPATVLSMSRVYASWNNQSWKRLLEVIPYKIPLKAGPASKSHPSLMLDEVDQGLVLPSFDCFQGWTGFGMSILTPALLAPFGLTKTAARSPSATSPQGWTKAAPKLLPGAPYATGPPHQLNTHMLAHHAAIPCPSLHPKLFATRLQHEGLHSGLSLSLLSFSLRLCVHKPLCAICCKHEVQLSLMKDDFLKYLQDHMNCAGNQPANLSPSLRNITWLAATTLPN